MSFADFKNSIATDAAPPAQLGKVLAALWRDQRGEWDAAHTLAQEDSGKEGAWVHAYLHRKEGDAPNAAYWYRLAGRPVASDSLTAEWEQIAKTLLACGK